MVSQNTHLSRCYVLLGLVVYTSVYSTEKNTQLRPKMYSIESTKIRKKDFFCVVEIYHRFTTMNNFIIQNVHNFDQSAAITPSQFKFWITKIRNTNQ